ncbi:MAG TPA: GNAT family N-acetyltransferase [Pyrinomonadaceae bacterium]|jgi:putative acetyltransferase|nr:GNAT family N-acetyltransferase [Pyrinomonadaceae bacterium]
MMLLRPAREPDTAGVHALIAHVYVEYGCSLNVEEEEHLQRPGPYFREHGGEFWVLEDDGAILATVAVVVHAAEDAAELKSLYVDASLRRQGWGRRLVGVASEYALRSGARRMFLWSDTRFVEAHGLYRSMGFRELDGTRELHDSNNSVEYGFDKSLV